VPPQRPGEAVQAEPGELVSQDGRAAGGVASVNSLARAPSRARISPVASGDSGQNVYGAIPDAA
jgi:hypothetical protein